MITTFEDLESFYSENPARRRSPESSHGVHWQLDGWDGAWRVSYIRDTGEVYALFQGPTQVGVLPTGESFVSSGKGTGPVLTIGTFPVDENPGPDDVYYLNLDLFLSGWMDHCDEPNGLAWMIRKMAQASLDETPENEGTLS